MKVLMADVAIGTGITIFMYQRRLDRFNIRLKDTGDLILFINLLI